jgi:hypothetical protein
MSAWSDALPTAYRFFVALTTITSLGGCGTNNAGDIPPDLLATLRKLNEPRDGGGGATYPGPPYGTKVGATVEDLCFDGWVNPAASDYDPAKTTKICLSDFHADADARLLLIESCAIWCVACKFEYGGSGDRPSLTEQLVQRKDKGFRVFGTIFQNGQSGAATAQDASVWSSTYSLSFPFAVDHDHFIGRFTSPKIAPFNMLIDTRAMKIVLALDGDEPAVLFGKVDSFLSGAP